MKQSKWEHRDEEQHKKKHGHREDGRCVKLTVRIQIEKAEKSKREKEGK